jgi:hypothetical protein
MVYLYTVKIGASSALYTYLQALWPKGCLKPIENPDEPAY